MEEAIRQAYEQGMGIIGMKVAMAVATHHKDLQPVPSWRIDKLFTLEKTKNGLSLKGIEGTAWTDLSFSCPDSRCDQAIDQKGMTN